MKRNPCRTSMLIGAVIAMLMAGISVTDVSAQQQRQAVGDDAYVNEGRSTKDFVYIWPDPPAGDKLPEAEHRTEGDDPNQLVNQRLPNLELEQFVGNKPMLKDKLVLIEFWSTASADCRGAIRRLNEIHKSFGDDVVVLSISAQSPAMVARYTEQQIDYYRGIDTKARMQQHVVADRLPHVIVVDRYGYVRWQGFPGLRNHNLTDDVLRSLIETHAKKDGN